MTVVNVDFFSKIFIQTVQVLDVLDGAKILPESSTPDIQICYDIR